MGIFGALSTAVTGLRAQAFSLENISGNISNSQTVGFKRIGLLHEEGAKGVLESVQALVAKSPGMGLLVRATYPAGTARSTAAASNSGVRFNRIASPSRQ